MNIINKNCYNFKKFIFDKGFLDDSVDATYIIHLENNGRLNKIYNQLKEYIPTKIVYILFNKGYKKCKKNDFIIDSGYDLVDAFFTIFKDSKNKNYKNILVLEDDFFFDPKIKNYKICDKINNFIIQKNNKSFMYILGCFPVINIPYNKYTNITLLKIGAHCCIYSSQLINYILKQSQENIEDWDTFTNLHCFKYSYKESLCYQLIANTENSKVCLNKYYILGTINNYIFKKLNLDKKVYPGYPFFYTLSQALFFIIIILLFIMIYFIFNYLTKYKK